MDSYESEMVRANGNKSKQDPDLCKTGIDVLDEKLGGGIPEGNTVLLVGSSGSGKTTLCMEFLANGARNDERSVFFTITEPLFKLTNNMEKFNFYDKQLIEKGIDNIKGRVGDTR